MSPPEREPSARDVMDAVLIAQDQMTHVRGEALTAADMRHAIEAGIKAAVSDPALWSAAVAAMRAHARQEAGTWLFSGIGAALSKLAWIIVIGLGVYLLGGWSALASFIKSGAHQ
jgi:hypothetical protein